MTQAASQTPVAIWRVALAWPFAAIGAIFIVVGTALSAAAYKIGKLNWFD